MRILLSRTDSIGDVMLTLPMAGFIKKQLPDAQIIFLGKTYTEDVVKCCSNIDEFLNWDEISNASDEKALQVIVDQNIDACIHVFPNRNVASLMKKAGIEKRIGTSGRLYHWWTCNSIVRFTRKRSQLHESQLNLKLLKGLNLPTDAGIPEIIDHMDFDRVPELSSAYQGLLKKDKVNLILHPKSKGSAVEWGLENFSKLIHLLPENRYHLFISGTEDDGKKIGNDLPFDANHVTSLIGKMPLKEFTAFISKADGLVAASTGPLHICAALGKLAIGLYSLRRPIHPGRWKPIGTKAMALVFDEPCEKCSKGKECDCIQRISPEKVQSVLDRQFFHDSERTTAH